MLPFSFAILKPVGADGPMVLPVNLIEMSHARAVPDGTLELQHVLYPRRQAALVKSPIAAPYLPFIHLAPRPRILLRAADLSKN